MELEQIVARQKSMTHELQKSIPKRTINYIIVDRKTNPPSIQLVDTTTDYLSNMTAGFSYADLDEYKFHDTIHIKDNNIDMIPPNTEYFITRGYDYDSKSQTFILRH